MDLACSARLRRLLLCRISFDQTLGIGEFDNEGLWAPGLLVNDQHALRVRNVICNASRQT